MARGDVAALADCAPAQAIDALQKLCHDLLAVRAGRRAALLRAADLPRAGRCAALARVVARARECGTNRRNTRSMPA